MNKILFNIIKAAATKIPWGTVVENTPALLDLVERARDRFRSSGTPGRDEQLKAIEEENLRLAETVLKMSDHLQGVTKTLEVVIARQKTLGVVSAVSLLTAIASLVLWAVK